MEGKTEECAIVLGRTLSSCETTTVFDTEEFEECVLELSAELCSSCCCSAALIRASNELLPVFILALSNARTMFLPRRSYFFNAFGADKTMSRAYLISNSPAVYGSAVSDALQDWRALAAVLHIPDKSRG